MDSSKKDEDQSKNKKLENQKSPYKLYSYNSIRPTPSADSKVYKVLLTATAAIIAEGVTFPLDITKTRLQLQNELVQKGTERQPYRGMIKTAWGILTEEGVSGMYQGLPPALLRHVVYSGIRITIYEDVRNLFKGPEGSEFSLWKKALAGATAGAIGQLVASPTDLVKVRLQAQRLNILKQQALQGTQKKVKGGFATTPHVRMYKGTIDAFITIVKQEGFLGLWKGVGPNVQRAALVNLGELASYDQSKEMLVKSGMFHKDDVITHTAAGAISGLFATIVSCPADVVKTRMMNQDGNLYRNSLDCFIKSVKAEGFFALYKGFWPTWARLAPWQLTFWIVYERLRLISGVGSF